MHEKRLYVDSVLYPKPVDEQVFSYERPGRGVVRYTYVGGKRRWYERVSAPAALLAIVLAVVVLGVGVWGIAGILSPGGSGSSDAESETELAEPVDALAGDEPAAETPRLAFDATAVDAASSTTEINLFSAFDASTEPLTGAQVADVEEALSSFSSSGYQAGFVVLDLATGRGVGYNADEEFFSASTVKAPFATFVYQELVDSGEVSLSDTLDKDVLIGGTGVMINEDETAYELEEVLADAIVYSDNIAYAMLREHYEGPAWDEWTVAAGVEQGVSIEGYYPFCSAKDLAKYWIAVGAYLDTDASGAAKMKSLLGSTEISFLREALGSHSTVYDKAGFEVDSENGDLGAINDAGIVSGPSGTYLIAVMSDVDYDSEWLTENSWMVVDLVEAIDALYADVLAS